MACIAVHAQTTFAEIGDVKYALLSDNTASANGISTAGKSKASLALTIPTVVSYGGKTYQVTGVANNAFKGVTNITSVYLDYGIGIIGDYAFQNATNVKTIHVPSTVVTVGQYAFQGIKSYEISFAGWTPPTFGPLAIFQTTGYPVSIIINPGVNKSAYCLALNAGNCSYNVENVKEGLAYDFMIDDVYLTVTDATTSTPEATVVGFNPTSSHTNFTLKDVTTSVNPYRHRIVAINKHAAYNDNKIKSLNLSQLRLLKTLDEEALYNCTALDSLNLGTHIEEIHSRAISSNIKNLFIPQSVTVFYSDAIYNNPRLERIIVDEQNTRLSSYHGVLYNKSQETLYRVPQAAVTVSSDGNQWTITSITDHDTNIWSPNLKTIRTHSFWFCNNLTSVEIPYGVSSIEQLAFSNCANLESCRIPSSVDKFIGLPFEACPNMKDIWLNMATVPGNIIDSSLGSEITMHVPYESVEAYQNNGNFRRFKEIKSGAYDFRHNDGHAIFDYTITSTDSLTIYYYDDFGFDDRLDDRYNEKYAGTAKIVGINLSSWSGSKLPLPTSLSITDAINNKYINYLVNTIDSEVFANYTMPSTDFTLELSRHTETICDKAFRGVSHLTGLKLERSLKYMGEEAFYGCRISNGLMFQYGIEIIGNKALSGNLIPSILIPSSIKYIGWNAFEKIIQLKWLSLNNKEMYAMTPTLTSVQTSCKLYVPTGVVEQYKNSGWNKLVISAGACDFTYNNAGLLNTRYHTTIISDEPITFEGVTYNGTAKYVYSPANNPGVLSTTAFNGGLYSTYTLNGVNKKYLIVEYDDSCLYNASDIVTLPLEQSRALKRIGKNAFQFTGITDVTIPENVTEIGASAFLSCRQLKEITFLSDVTADTWGKEWFAGNADDFKCYVKWNQWGASKKFSKNWTTNGIPRSCIDAYYLRKTETDDLIDDVQADVISVGHPVDWQKSELGAVVLDRYDNPDDNYVCFNDVARQTATGEGVLVVAEINKLYKLQRPSEETIEPCKNFLHGNPDSDLQLSQAQEGDERIFYWDDNEGYFRHIPATYTLPAGSAYLKVKSNRDALGVDKYIIPGDVNEDGVVDVSDINIVIDYILKGYYHFRHDLNHDGAEDVSDLNILINTILGK